MKATVNAVQPERKVVAVVGEAGKGVFFPNYGGVGSIHIDAQGRAVQESRSLSLILSDNSRRTAIYEGDTVTLQF